MGVTVIFRLRWIVRLFVLFLLFLSITVTATRPLPSDSSVGKGEISATPKDDGSKRHSALVSEEWTEEGTSVEESCEDIEEEECVSRRILEAHTDYIYTQHHPHP